MGDAIVIEEESMCVQKQQPWQIGEFNVAKSDESGGEQEGIR